MSEKIELIEWRPNKVRIQFSVIDDTPEVAEDDPTYPVNKGTLWATAVELDSTDFVPPQGDLQALVDAETAKLSEAKHKADAEKQAIAGASSLPPPANMFSVTVEHTHDDSDPINHGYSANIEIEDAATDISYEDFSIRDCTSDYSTVHGEETFDDTGHARLRSEREQQAPITGWFLEIYDRKNDKSVHRWTMPSDDHKATLTVPA